jgi:hypothetical protein
LDDMQTAARAIERDVMRKVHAAPSAFSGGLLSLCADRPDERRHGVLAGGRRRRALLAGNP